MLRLSQLGAEKYAEMRFSRSECETLEHPLPTTSSAVHFAAFMEALLLPVTFIKQYPIESKPWQMVGGLC